MCLFLKVSSSVFIKGISLELTIPLYSEEHSAVPTNPILVPRFPMALSDCLLLYFCPFDPDLHLNTDVRFDHEVKWLTQYTFPKENDKITDLSFLLWNQKKLIGIATWSLHWKTNKQIKTTKRGNTDTTSWWAMSETSSLTLLHVSYGLPSRPTPPAQAVSFGGAGCAVDPTLELSLLPQWGSGPSGHFLTTHMHQQLQWRGQSATRPALVPERRKRCHPPSVNRSGCSHCLPWKPHSLKYKLLCQGRCTIWDVFQVHHCKARGIQPQRLRGSFSLCLCLPGRQPWREDSGPGAG